MAYWLGGFRRWSDFEGRGTRRETFAFLVIAFVADIIVGAFSAVVFPNKIPPLVNAIVGLIFFFACLPVIAKRLHDIGLSGRWIFISVIPVIGWLILLVLLVLPPSKKADKYGVNPRVAKSVADKARSAPHSTDGRSIYLAIIEIERRIGEFPIEEQDEVREHLETAKSELASDSPRSSRVAAAFKAIGRTARQYSLDTIGNVTEDVVGGLT